MTKKILITGASGQIAYSLLFRLAEGALFGPTTPIDLHLYDLPEMEKALQGVKMELDDSCFPQLKSIKIETSFEKAAEGIDIAFLIGAKPRGPGQERADLLGDNGKIFIAQGKALNRVAKKEVVVLVVGNPCNTNALLAMRNAPNIPRSQFFAMTMLDQMRGEFALAEKALAVPADIKNFFIFGNHSKNLVPDFTHATLFGKPITEAIKDEAWLRGPFCQHVQERGSAIINARGKSSAASAASAALRQMRFILGLEGKSSPFSAAVFSEGNPYGIDPALFYSFPIISLGEGKWRFHHEKGSLPWLVDKMKISEKELLEERALVEAV